MRQHTDDEIFEALSDGYRRVVLFTVLEETTGADQSVYLEPSSNEVGETNVIKQRHVHLPKLAEYGFVNWNQGEHCVSRGPRFDEISPLLRRLDSYRETLTDETVHRSAR